VPILFQTYFEAWVWLLAELSLRCLFSLTALLWMEATLFWTMWSSQEQPSPFFATGFFNNSLFPFIVAAWEASKSGIGRGAYGTPICSRTWFGFAFLLIEILDMFSTLCNHCCTNLNQQSQGTIFRRRNFF
jgi:hypothetical protein